MMGKERPAATTADVGGAEALFGGGACGLEAGQR